MIRSCARTAALAAAALKFRSRCSATRKPRLLLNFCPVWPSLARCEAASKNLFAVVCLLLPLQGWCFWKDQLMVADPLYPDQSCAVHGSERFIDSPDSSETAYDQIFPPFNDFRYLWVCEKSGYVSFKADFNRISADEIVKVKAFLAGKELSSSPHDQLQTLKAIYQQRNVTVPYQIFIHRAVAVIYQSLEDTQHANAERAMALELMKPILATPMPLDMELEYLFLAANYSRQLGQVADSVEYLARLQTLLSRIPFHRRTPFQNQIMRLAEKTVYIQSGGKLAPRLPEGLPAETNSSSSVGHRFQRD